MVLWPGTLNRQQGALGLPAQGRLWSNPHRGRKQHPTLTFHWIEADEGSQLSLHSEVVQSEQEADSCLLVKTSRGGHPNPWPLSNKRTSEPEYEPAIRAAFCKPCFKFYSSMESSVLLPNDCGPENGPVKTFVSLSSQQISQGPGEDKGIAHLQQATNTFH